MVAIFDKDLQHIGTDTVSFSWKWTPGHPERRDDNVDKYAYVITSFIYFLPIILECRCERMSFLTSN